ncbi:MAG TPA: hypothetical protein VNT51_09515, partial [Miltoncostaeaceae bacterium]|nr:hypothetical protein [Miltoncostaeaceae bacterium]
SWAPREEEALALAHDQWRSNVFAPPIPWDLPLPEYFDEISNYVEPDDVRKSVWISSDLQRHIGWVQEFAALGFDEVVLHHVGQDQDAFIDTFGTHVLPALAAG